MTDLVLVGIFILCLITGYLVVKRSGGFVEQIFFKNPKMWYDVRESNEPCRTETGADAGACSREDASGRRKIGRTPASPEKRSFFGRGTAHKTGRDAGAGNACLQAISRDSGSIGRSNRSTQESDAAPARGPRAERITSFFGHSTAQKSKVFKAGIKHEWKTGGRGPKQQIWKPQ